MIGKLVVLSVVVAIVKGQGLAWGTGPCPDVSVVQNFDVTAYLGKWYQLVRFPNPFELGNCSTATYGPITNGTVKVHNTEIREGEESFVDGTAELADPNSTEAKLIVKFFSPDTVADYWVLGTDYLNYSVVYTCRKVQNFHIVFSWVLGRSKPISVESIAEIKVILDKNGIDSSYYAVHDLPECQKEPPTKKIN